MTAKNFASKILPLDEGVLVNYSLLSEDTGLYGVQVEMLGEKAAHRGLTTDRVEIEGFLQRISDGGVTPCALGDVVADWSVR